MRRARVLVADPPWPSKPMHLGRERIKKSESVKKYALMPVNAICAFPQPRLADNAVLFLWRLASRLKDGESGQAASLRVCEAWGFQPYGELVWDKLTVTGKPWFGMGMLLHGSHETCLVGFRGSIKMLKTASNERTRFAAPVRAHSSKPDEFYALVERMFPGGPFVELFARRPRRGWRGYGDQLPGADAAPGRPRR